MIRSDPVYGTRLAGLISEERRRIVGDVINDVDGQRGTGLGAAYEGVERRDWEGERERERLEMLDVLEGKVDRMLDKTDALGGNSGRSTEGEDRGSDMSGKDGERLRGSNEAIFARSRSEVISNEDDDKGQGPWRVAENWSREQKRMASLGIGPSGKKWETSAGMGMKTPEKNVDVGEDKVDSAVGSGEKGKGKARAEDIEEGRRLVRDYSD